MSPFTLGIKKEGKLKMDKLEILRDLSIIIITAKVFGLLARRW